MSDDEAKSAPPVFGSFTKDHRRVVFAENGDLLLQDTVRLAERLMELRKSNWEVAVYPVEDHGAAKPQPRSTEANE